MSELKMNRNLVYTIEELAILRHDKKVNVRCVELENSRELRPNRAGGMSRRVQRPRNGVSIFGHDRNCGNGNYERRSQRTVPPQNSRNTDKREGFQMTENDRQHIGDGVERNKHNYNMSDSYPNVKLIDLLAFPPGSSIVRIGPGIPIPKGAVPLPFSFEEAYELYSQTNILRQTASGLRFNGVTEYNSNLPHPEGRSTKSFRYNLPLYPGASSVDHMPHQVPPIQNREMISMATEKQKYGRQEASGSYTSRFKYDPEKPANVDNPYSVTGFFPSYVRNNSSPVAENRKVSDTQNSSSSLNDTDSSATIGSSCDSYNIQIQIPSVS